MSKELWAAIIGALVGGIIAFLSSWLIIKLTRKYTKEDKNWDLKYDVIDKTINYLIKAQNVFELICPDQDRHLAEIKKLKTGSLIPEKSTHDDDELKTFQRSILKRVESIFGSSDAFFITGKQLTVRIAYLKDKKLSNDFLKILSCQTKIIAGSCPLLEDMENTKRELSEYIFSFIDYCYTYISL
ncbi:MAG: hypothetical protein EHM45_06330 [Desulfobacteraceae bacterium]|nr:MAG: hypothetical protein EHM45_06330 [Desulfobacteraceae bacterium]